MPLALRMIHSLRIRLKERVSAVLLNFINLLCGVNLREIRGITFKNKGQEGTHRLCTTQEQHWLTLLADYIHQTREELLLRLPFSKNVMISRRDEGSYELGQRCAAANGIQQSRNKVKSPEMGQKAWIRGEIFCLR